MSQIQSNFGLVSGVPIFDTVDQLIAVSARPRDLLQTRNQGIQAQQLALSQISTLLSGVRTEVEKLGDVSLFQSREVVSQNPDALTATLSETNPPPSADYQFTPLRTASAQQLLSNSFGNGASGVGVGELTIGYGGFLDTQVDLAELNEGRGVNLGRVRVTDRSGTSATIDLRFARTVDDVLQAFNSGDELGVELRVRDDRFELIDRTSQAAAQLSVQEIGTGSTARDLGLANVQTTGSHAVGEGVFRAHSGLQLDSLNDGFGVHSREGIDDLEITLRDGSTVGVDLFGARTLGDAVERIEAAAPEVLQATIAADGERLQIVDTQGGKGEFIIRSALNSTAAEDLGIASRVFGSQIVGERIHSGLGSTLLKNLQGGKGIDSLGVISLTDRSGATVSVDLAGAETVHDILHQINNTKGIGVDASLNAQGSGILLRDTSAGSGQFIVTDGDATETATALGITYGGKESFVESGTLDRRTVGFNTLLSDFGQGVASGSFVITNSLGDEGAVRLNTPGSEITTIGGVLEKINSLDLQIEARINETGDGIELIDSAGGGEDLSVREVGRGTTAADLRIAAPAVRERIDGIATQTISGSTRHTVSIAGEIGLDALNGGNGIEPGSFLIRDSEGKSAQIELGGEDTAVTIGEVIERINSAAIDVTARVNDEGTGIYLVDEAGGAAALQVTDLAGGTTARDLGLKKPVQSLDFEGQTRQVIDGAGTFDSSLVDRNALDRVAAAINEFNGGITATTIFDGSGSRLSLTADQTGSGREILVDTGTSGVEFTELTAARDAVLALGDANSGSSLLVTSETNTFDDVVQGLNVTVTQATQSPITINVSETDAPLQEAVGSFVDALNSLRSSVNTVTAFDPEAGTRGVLFGSSEILRIDRDLFVSVTGAFNGAGAFRSLGEVGIEVDDVGNFSLDAEKLSQAFTENPQALIDLFTTEESGVVAKLEQSLSRLVEKETGVLSRRTEGLKDKVEANNRRIERLNERLENERQRLLSQFFQMEAAIAKSQSNIAALSNLQVVPPVTSGPSLPG